MNDLRMKEMAKEHDDDGGLDGDEFMVFIQPEGVFDTGSRRLAVLLLLLNQLPHDSQVRKCTKQSSQTHKNIKNSLTCTHGLLVLFRAIDSLPMKAHCEKYRSTFVRLKNLYSEEC